jgi:RNA-binding protein
LSCARKTTERTSLGDYLPKLRQANADSFEKEEGEAISMSGLTDGKKRFVKRQLRDKRPTILIGKSGASEELLGEIGKQLDRNKMVKVKILKTALSGDETKQLTQKIAAQTESALIEVRGHTFMLYKSRKK